jgi:hypothetical protein
MIGLKTVKFTLTIIKPPERYKIQLATMNFTGDAEEWFSCFHLAS